MKVVNMYTFCCHILDIAAFLSRQIVCHHKKQENQLLKILKSQLTIHNRFKADFNLQKKYFPVLVNIFSFIIHV